VVQGTLTAPSISWPLFVYGLCDPDIWVDAFYGLLASLWQDTGSCNIVEGWKAAGRDIGWAEAIALSRMGF